MTEQLCVVCPHVFANERPVRVFIHHYDESWQAVCGEQAHKEDCSDFRLVGLNPITERQPELQQFEAMTTSVMAEHTLAGWRVSGFDE